MYEKFWFDFFVGLGGIFDVCDLMYIQFFDGWMICVIGFKFIFFLFDQFLLELSVSNIKYIIKFEVVKVIGYFVIFIGGICDFIMQFQFNDLLVFMIKKCLY